MANQYRKSTLKFTFQNEFVRPRALEVERFIREEAKIPSADVVGIHLSIVSSVVYVKIINEAACERILRETKRDLRFCHADGNVGTVTLDHAGLGLRTIRIFELPFELPAEEVVAALRPYGTVQSHIAEKWTQFHTYPVLNGVRQIRIELIRHVPSYITIGGCRAIVIYDGQPKTCSGCGKEGHLRSECMQRRITQLPLTDVVQPSQSTVLPLTYVAALTNAATSPNLTTLPDALMEDTKTRRDEETPVPRTETSTSTAPAPATEGEPQNNRMAIESLIVPTAAFVPDRRESLHSSDTEGHIRKQGSQKRRKRRRKSPADQAEDQTQEDEDSTHQVDATFEAVATGSSVEMQREHHEASKIPAVERLTIVTSDGCCPSAKGEQAHVLRLEDAMEEDPPPLSTAWADDTEDEQATPTEPASMTLAQ